MYSEYLRFALNKDGKVHVVVVLYKLREESILVQYLPYKIQVWHQGDLVKTLETEKFHMAMYVFKKTIDLEVQADAQGTN